MKYEQSAICKSHRYCEICRRKSKQGAAYRRSIAQMVNEQSEDFECPVNLPWLSENPTVEELLAFSRQIDDKLIDQFTTTNPVIRVSLDKENLNLLFRQQKEVRVILGDDHRVVKAMTEIVKSQVTPAGCTGCRMSKLLRLLAGEIDKCTKEEKIKIVNLLNKSINR